MRKQQLINKFSKYSSNKEILSELNFLISNWYSFSNKKIPSNDILEEDYPNLFKACFYWVNIRIDELSGFRSQIHDKIFHKFIYNSIVNNIPLNYISILCPSYKKEKGSYGFASEPGNSTYRSIANLTLLYENTLNLNIPCTKTVYFADIALEQYDKIKNNPVELNSLEEIIKIDRIISKSHDIPYHLLSDIAELEKIVGYEGVFNNNPDVSQIALQRAKWKDRQFYSEQYGWKEIDCDNRTQVLAHSYSHQTKELVKIFNQPILLYSGHDYEKGTLYNGINRKANIAILYFSKGKNNQYTSTVHKWLI